MVKSFRIVEVALSLTLKVSVEFSPEVCYHVDFQYQADSFAVSTDYVPVLVLVVIDLQLQFFVDVVMINMQFQFEFVLMRKLQINGVANLQTVLVFLQ